MLMDKDTQTMIEQLTVLAGTIMEDSSVEAVSSLSFDANKRQEQVAMLSQAGADIATLLAAAEVVERYAREADI